MRPRSVKIRAYFCTCLSLRNPAKDATMTAIDLIRDPVARARAQLNAHLMLLRTELGDAEDSARITEIEGEIEQAQRQLESLDMCFA